VPMYVVSPWSKGGWVSSEIFDHTSVGQFLERRFGVTIPAISPWHRAVCGDMTSCFDFSKGADAAFPALPDVSDSAAILDTHLQRPKALPPRTPQDLFQEKGIRRSRALPYVLHVDARIDAGKKAVVLDFINEGTAGAVFHVYDKRDLDRIPRRYTVEAGKKIDDRWTVGADGAFDLWVLGPNGFHRAFRGTLAEAARAPTMTARYNIKQRALAFAFSNEGGDAQEAKILRDAYLPSAGTTVTVASRGKAAQTWQTSKDHDWYDVSVALPGIEIRLAGRIERGTHGISDPLTLA